MWEFDLSTNQWAEIKPGSVLTPGVRSNTYLATLEDKRKIVLLGGNLPTGPTSDLWLYDIENEPVISIQWKLIDPIGKPPPRAYYRAVCDYFHEGRHYIAVYGGLFRNTYVHTLFMYFLNSLDLQTFTWTELPAQENSPSSYLLKMIYYNSSLYLWSGSYIYKYELMSNVWIITQTTAQ
jgi:hypothetical protein